MASLSISEAWNETAAFVRREAQLIFPIAFLLISLPSALMQASLPVVVPGELPPAGLWLLLIPVAALLAMIGNIAINLLALRPGTSVGESLQHGARRFLILFAASLLIGLGIMLAMIPVILILSVLLVASGPTAIVPAITFLLVVPMIIFVWVRLILLLTPIVAVEELGPVALLRRSWALSKGQSLKLLGLLLLMMVLALVVSLAVGAIAGLLILFVAGPPLPGTLGGWLLLTVSALVQAVLSSVFAVLIARVYAQLTPTDRAGVFA